MEKIGLKKIVPYLKWTLIPVFLAAAAALLALFGSYTRTDMEELYLTPFMDDANGWEIYVIDDGQRAAITPGELMDIDLDRTYYLSRVLTQDMRDGGYTLLTVNNYRPAAIFLDGELIYTNCSDITPKLDQTVFPKEFNGYDIRGEQSCCVLPENYAGKRITIASKHGEYASMPMIIMSSLTADRAVYIADASGILFPAVCFAVTALILFGMWLYGVFSGIRGFSALIVIAAAMIQSFSYLQQFEFRSLASTAMDTVLTIYVPMIAVVLPLFYFLWQLDKKRNRVLYGIILAVTSAAAAAFQTAALLGAPYFFEATQYIPICFSAAALIVFAVLEAKNGNKELRLFLGGLAAVLLAAAVRYFLSLPDGGYYAANMSDDPLFSIQIYLLNLINPLGMALFILAALISFYSLIRRTVRIQTDLVLQNERLQSLDRAMAAQKQFYEAKLTKEEEIRSLRHDMNGHLSTLSSLLNDNKPEEAASYLSGVIRLHGERKSEPLCDDPYMNAVLTEYDTKCRDNNISFVCHIGIGDHELPATELCLILNNSLENAVEACMKLPENERKIKVQAAVRQNRFLLRISNSFNGVIKKTEELPVTEKEGKEHGYGLSNIQQATKRMGGSVVYRIENEFFVLDVEFPLL